MILSMTGFGKGVAASAEKKITVEIKSLNSKQLDLMMRVPSSLRELEAETRNTVASLLQRGKVDLVATCESLTGQPSTVFNIDIIRSYKEQICRMARALEIQEPADWYQVLLRFPDVTSTPPSDLSDEDFEAFRRATREAADALTAFRLQEGRKLYDFFTAKIEAIGNLLTRIDPYEQERVPKIRARLEEQLGRLDSIEYDRSRLEQEMIFYIEKLDINEEKLRLRSHLNYFIETMGAIDEIPEQGQGKKLGFIAQEMGRETNTLGSKANHAEMQRIVVKMKDELEQIKEQVLNVL